MTLEELIVRLQKMNDDLSRARHHNVRVLIGLGVCHAELLTDVGIYIGSDGRPSVIVESSGHSTSLIGGNAEGKGR